ncbi:MAG: TGS domain-containing protein [Candidatus Aenigmatarchaeota archaeon]
MPLNAGVEFFKAQEKYLKARTREEKIAALEEMLSVCPTHKGAENMRAELRAKLAKLKREKPPKSARRTFSLPKEGDAQVCIIGPTQSGKSTLLSILTNAKPEISDRPFTTTEPQVGMMEWKGVRIQLVEIPSTCQSIYMNIAQNSDGVIIVYDGTKDVARQKWEMDEVLARFKIRRPSIEVLGKKAINSEELKESVWKMLGLIRIYTKEAGKEPSAKALVLKKGATVRDAANRIHKDFVRLFQFAKVWGRSAKHPGEKVGLDHRLQDGDILEIRAK